MKEKYRNQLLLAPIYGILTILPLIVKMHTYHSRLNEYNWYSMIDICYDFFLYYKQWIFVILAGYMLLIVLFHQGKDYDRVKRIKIMIPLFGYLSMTILSTLFSKYRFFGLYGISEQFENVFCIIGYVLIVYYCCLVVTTEHEVNSLICAYGIGALLLGLIGTAQAMGFDYLEVDSIKQLIAEPGFDVSLIYPVFGKFRVYQTLYNPNYVGVYTVMVITFFTVLFLQEHSVKKKVFYYFIILLSAISMCGSQFKTGIICLVIVFFTLLIMFFHDLKNVWRPAVEVFIALCAAFILTNARSGWQYQNALKWVVSSNGYEKDLLTGMDTTKQGVIITYDGEKFIVSLDAKKDLVLKKEDNTILSLQKEKESEEEIFYRIEDSKLHDICLVRYKKENLKKQFSFLIKDKMWNFWYSEVENNYFYINRYGRICPIQTAESAIFTGHEHLASRRGYIWSRTIPLLKKHILIGSGADTFIIQYPQYDYVAMSNVGYEDEVITKPHNIYLQIGVQSGGIALLCYLVFFIWYIISSGTLFFRKKKLNGLSLIGAALFLAISSFLFTGLTNDSTICVSPVFWVLTGLGVSVNDMIKKSI